MKNDPRIKTIIIFSIFIGLALFVGSLFVFGGEHAGGVLAGAAVGTLNFYFLVLLVRQLVGGSASTAGLVVRFLLKYGLIGAMILTVAYWLHVSLYGFVVGVSNFIVAILIVGLFAKEPVDS